MLMHGKTCLIPIMVTQCESLISWPGNIHIMALYIYTLWQCTFTHYGNVHLHIMALYIYTLWQCTFTHYGNVHLHIMAMYIYTLWQCTFTHYGNVHLHIMALYIYTLWQCTFTHYGNVHLHIMAMYIYTLWQCTFTHYGNTHFLDSVLKCVSFVSDWYCMTMGLIQPPNQLPFSYLTIKGSKRILIGSKKGQL